MMPNQDLFEFPIETDTVESHEFKKYTQPIFISKCSTMRDLNAKICRILGVYMLMKHRREMNELSKLRLWKSHFDTEDPNSGILKKLQEIE